MPVRIGVVKELHHVADLLRALRVFLADVPVQRQRVTEARDEFAAVEPALRPELAAVERLGHEARLGLIAAAVVVDFVLLEFEVEVEPLGRGVVEHDAPLVELGAIPVKLVIPRDERPDVVAIAARVVGQEGEDVHAFAGQVIQSPDQPLALAAFPNRVARFPVGHMRRVVMERLRR